MHCKKLVARCLNPRCPFKLCMGWVHAKEEFGRLRVLVHTCGITPHSYAEPDILAVVVRKTLQGELDER